MNTDNKTQEHLSRLLLWLKLFASLTIKIIKNPLKTAEELSEKPLKFFHKNLFLPTVLLTYIYGLCLVLFSPFDTVISVLQHPSVILYGLILLPIIMYGQLCAGAFSFFICAKFFNGRPDFKNVLKMIIFSFNTFYVVIFVAFVGTFFSALALANLIATAAWVYCIVILYKILHLYVGDITRRIIYLIVSYIAYIICLPILLFLLLSIPAMTISSGLQYNSLNTEILSDNHYEDSYTPPILNQNGNESDNLQAEDMKKAIMDMQNVYQNMGQQTLNCIQDKITAQSYEDFKDYRYDIERRTHDLCNSGKESEATTLFRDSLVDVHKTNDTARIIHGCASDSNKATIDHQTKAFKKLYGDYYNYMPKDALIQELSVKPPPKNICFHVNELYDYHYYSDLP